MNFEWERCQRNERQNRGSVEKSWLQAVVSIKVTCFNNSHLRVSVVKSSMCESTNTITHLFPIISLSVLLHLMA